MKISHFLAGAVLLIASPAAAQNLINNGDFESGSLSSFTQFGNMSSSGVDEAAAADGTFGAFFGPRGSVGGISQTIATSAGESFLISFDLSNDGGQGTFFEVLFGGTQLFTGTDTNPFDFTRFSTFAVAAGPSTTLSFAFRQDPAFFSLDNISVTAVSGAVPETDTWAMMLFGFGTVGAGMRRRKIAGTVRLA
jgi:hypothetical protein